MALGRNVGGGLRLKRGAVAGDALLDGEEQVGLGISRYPRGLGRKRIEISNDMKNLPHPLDSAGKSQPKKQCSRNLNLDSEISNLESLPQDILIKVVCGVNHDDLKQLVLVSKSVREAASIAKECHFAFNTPLKISVFSKSIGFEPSTFSEIEAPNAPLRTNSFRSRLSSKKLSDISVALFSSPDEDRWLNKELSFDAEV